MSNALYNSKAHNKAQQSLTAFAGKITRGRSQFPLCLALSSNKAMIRALVERIEAEEEMSAKERVLREVLCTQDFSLNELSELKASNTISRSSDLIYIVEIKVRELEYSESHQKAEKESFLKKFLMGLGFWS